METHNPIQLNKDTSSKQSLGESAVSNNQHQVEGSEATQIINQIFGEKLI